MRVRILIFLFIIHLNQFVGAQNPWSQKANLTGGVRAVGIGFDINGKGYMGLGQNASGTKLYDFWEYNPAADNWTQKTNYPGGGSFGASAFVANGKGYVCLGANNAGTAQKDLWEYTPSSNSWTQKANFPGSARYGASCFVVNDTAFIIGGSTGGPPYLADVYMYIPSTDKWTKMSNFAGGNRIHGVGFTIGKTGYAGTGLKASSTYSNDIWKYNKSSDTWTQIKDLPGSARQSCIGFGMLGKAYFGTGASSSSKLKDFYEYDPTSNTWTQLTNVPSSFSARHAAACFVINGIGYVGTGAPASGALNDLWAYTPINYTRNCVGDSTYVWPLATDELDSVIWNFGDTASGAKNISKSINKAYHIYTKSGAYKVKLYYFFKTGKDSTTILIPVKSAKPFIGNDTVYCNTSSFSKALKPQKNYIKYKWSNGDTLKTSTVKSRGTYILIATDTAKCILADTIIIKSSGVSTQFMPNDTVVCNNYHSIEFKNRTVFSYDTLKTLLWKFSDNTNSSDSVLKKTFSTVDSFRVKLVVTSKYGCRDSLSKYVVVNPNTSIDFSINTSTQCFNGHDFVLTNKSTVSKGTISYWWNFGDGNTATSKDISSKKYAQDSTYLISLITTTSKGCKDTISKTVVVNASPKSAYSINQSTQCFTFHSYDFTNSSTIRTGKISKTVWNFGDGKSDTTKHIAAKKYSTVDSFSVMLLSISDKGCRDSITQKAYITPNTAINFSINKTPQCFNGHDFVLTNGSTVSKGSYSSIWRFGDGDTAITKDITSKKYAKDSTYKVTLITKTDKGCMDTITRTVVLNPNPKSVFSINQPIQCYTYNRYNFTNSSTIRTGNIVKNNWDFGDGKSDTSKSITGKKYATVDSFQVQLLTISDKGCRDSIRKKVYIDPNTTVGFNINKTPQCFNGHDFVFTNSSTVLKGTITYDWSFGDGSSAANKDISTKKYSLDSTYKVTLISTTDKGCKDTISKNITVHPSPKASFGINQVTQCFKWNLYDYTNSSTIRTGNIVTNTWNLGDADSRTTKDIKGKHYSTEDSFKVDLLTVSNNGCRDSSKKWVYIQNTPKPGFTINQDTQCFNEHAFDFTNTTTIAAGNFTTLWQLGDATTNTNLDVTQKKYSVFGNYKVMQITSSNNNCKDSLQKSIRIHASPDTKFNIDKDRQCFRGNVFNFTNPSSIPEGTITYYWTIGEGKTFTSKDVVNHKYATEDTFNVRLVTTSNKGCKDTLTKMAVTYAQPSASFVVPQDSQCWQKHYLIIINNTTLKYGTLNHVWDFGDGTKDFTHTPSTKRYANKSANYVLKYKVKSDHGCTDSAQKKVSLLERPIAEFTINDSIQCFKTNTFSFVNKTAFSDLTTITYFWDYGDGSKTTGKNAKSLSYPTADYYTVGLIAHSYLNNCVDTLEKIIVVAPHASPNYTIDNDSQCLRTNVFKFTNQSTLKFGTLKYNWNFGDNTKDTATNPVKKYTNGSNYSVKMVATTNYNCKDSINKPLVIIPHPKSNFKVADSTLCKVQSLNITNNTTVLYGTFSQTWHFDEGADQTGLNVSGKKLNASGFHPVRLAVISNFGCTDTITKQVFVEQSGTTKISIIENDSQCLRGNQTKFNVFSQGGTINLASFIWNFGDGNSSSIQNPTHTYTQDSSFKISAETVSSNGCLDTAYFNVVILPHPITNFAATSPCFPNPTVLTNLSKVKYGSIASQIWDLGNSGMTATILNPIMSYPSDGTFNVKLKNFSDFGCSDSIIKQVVVRPKPMAMFSYTLLPSPDEVRLQMNNLSSADVVTNNWDMDKGITSQMSNPIAVYTDSGRFSLTLEVINAAGCSDTFNLKTGLYYPEFVFYLPTVFSPNGNGINDIFKPNGSQYNRKYTMEIFNRWGQRVFITNDVTQGWDGTYQDKECPDGIYHCYVRIMPMKGPLKSYYSGVTLLR